MKLTTYRFRLKDSSCRSRLRKLGFAVNRVWNYVNERNAYQWSFRRKLLSAFDLHKLTAGAGKELGLHSQTVQAVVDEYCKCGKQFKRPKLNWRSRKRSLGWIPFKAVGVKVVADSVTYNGQTFRFGASRPLPGKVRFGSFCEDAQGRWYVNFVCEDLTPERKPTGKEAGIDLGLKTLATLSDGIELSRENLTKKFEVKLATAQRARKKKQVTRIHARIKNKRKDWNHKQTTLLTNEYDVLVVGNVSSSKLKKTKMAKSVSDAGWADFKTMRKCSNRITYKAIRLGVTCLEVNESFSTVTCSVCKERTGPKGIAGLGVRTWGCSTCGTEHNTREPSRKSRAVVAVAPVEPNTTGTRMLRRISCVPLGASSAEGNPRVFRPGRMSIWAARIAAAGSSSADEIRSRPGPRPASSAAAGPYRTGAGLPSGLAAHTVSAIHPAWLAR